MQCGCYDLQSLLSAVMLLRQRMLFECAGQSSGRRYLFTETGQNMLKRGFIG